RAVHRLARRRRAPRGVAPAVDHLLVLDEELDLSDPPAPALQIVARPDPCALREMVADARGHLPHLVDHAEIERRAPDEGLDRIEEALAERDVTGAGPGADKGGALPRQSARFIMRDCRIDRKRDR